MVERIVIILVCASIVVTGLLVLVAWDYDDPPVRATPGEVADLAPGTEVLVEGWLVDDAGNGENTFSILRLEGEDGETVRLFLTFPVTNLVQGDRLRVIGKVSLYRGEVEVVVSSPEDIEVLPDGARIHEGALGSLIERPWLFEGSEVTIQVEVATWPMEDLDGDTLWCIVSVPDGDGDVTAFAQLGPDISEGIFEPGARLDLRVMVRYDPSSGFVYLEVLGLA
ncbi:MAG: hypothetical protein KAS77_12715 [Thermoplasmata archaeon]|nr:hypothetical protein [Thermoplasmata archaeon]